jgi:hypothetical protein
MTRRMSLAVIVTASLVVAAASTGTQAPLPGVPACRHDIHEREADRTRRQQALALAKAINEAEGTIAERTRRYRPLAELRNLPPAPSGFDVRLYTDGAGYMLSIKDRLDPCRYGIFSDESTFLYERTPQAAPIIASDN